MVHSRWGQKQAIPFIDTCPKTTVTTVIQLLKFYGSLNVIHLKCEVGIPTPLLLVNIEIMVSYYIDFYKEKIYSTLLLLYEPLDLKLLFQS